jgi:hypothetical protein
MAEITGGTSSDNAESIQQPLMEDSLYSGSSSSGDGDVSGHHGTNGNLRLLVSKA